MIASGKDIDILRDGGRRLTEVLAKVTDIVKVGIKTTELDKLAGDEIRQKGDTPSFLGYRPRGSKGPYPATLCVSVNEEVVHGLPSDRKLENGDIVGLDIGLIHNGFYLDMAVTVPVGDISKGASKLITSTQNALARGIEAARCGNTIGDIGHAIESSVSGSGFGIVRELGGHGVGDCVHGEPFIPNYGEAGSGIPLTKGMVLALEPMLTAGKENILLLSDGFTYATKDGSLSAHFEHTILVTDSGPEILTTTN